MLVLDHCPSLVSSMLSNAFTLLERLRTHAAVRLLEAKLLPRAEALTQLLDSVLDRLLRAVIEREMERADILRNRLGIVVHTEICPGQKPARARSNLFFFLPPLDLDPLTPLVSADYKDL